MVERAGAFGRTVAIGGPDVEAALTAIERDLLAVASAANYPPTAISVERFAVKSGVATHRQMTLALNTFDCAANARAQASFAASYTPPPKPNLLERMTARFVG